MSSVNESDPIPTPEPVQAGSGCNNTDTNEITPESGKPPVLTGGRRKNRRSGRKNKKSKRLSVKKLLKMVGMKGGNVTAEATNYTADSAGGNTSTQVISTFGGIGQQTGSAGPSSGLIQPLSQGKMGGGRKSKRGGSRKLSGGSAVDHDAGLVDSAYNKLITNAGSSNSANAMPVDTSKVIFAQSAPSKPIYGGKRRKGKKSLKKGGGQMKMPF